MSESGETPPEGVGRRLAGSFFSGSTIGVPVLVFVLGVMTGFPVAIFGFDILITHAATAFAVLFGILFILVVGGVLLIAFRRQILGRLFGHADVELHRIAEPMGSVIRHVSERRVAEATAEAGSLVRFVMARYAWIATRRWVIAAVTGFVAVIATLAGSALLFQQNQLLRIQSDLMRQQTERLTEQTLLLETQIELGEAQRSTSIVPEILAIGAAIAEETEAARARTPGEEAGLEIVPSTALSSRLSGRIIAATAAARPYRYLRNGLDGLSDDQIIAASIAGRADLAATQEELALVLAGQAEVWGLDADGQDAPGSGTLIDRATSPERGQILAMLHNAGMADIDMLTAGGAEFSFAEVRAPLLAHMRLAFGKFDFADFSRVAISEVSFEAAQLDHARFRQTSISNSAFGALANIEISPPFSPHPLLPFQPSRLIGADFRLAQIRGSDFSNAHLGGANFDGAAILGTRFAGAVLGTATLRSAILYDVDFTEANLTKADFDGAVVFDPEFLDKVHTSALMGTFDRTMYELEPIGDELMVTHPNVSLLAELPVDVQNNQQPLRLRRIYPLEAAGGAMVPNRP